MLEQLETTRREIDKHGVGLGSEMCATLNRRLITAEGQLQVATEELESNRAVVVQLQTEKDAVCLEREELRAEVALLQAKLRRMEHLGVASESGGSSGSSSPIIPRAVATTGDRTVPGIVTGAGAGGDSHSPLRADAPGPVFSPAEGLPMSVRSPIGAVSSGGVAADCAATEALTGTVSAPERVTPSLGSVSSTVAVPAGVLVPGGEGGSQPCVIPTCGSAVTTVNSVASTPRSSVIPPSPPTTVASSVMSAAGGGPQLGPTVFVDLEVDDIKTADSDVRAASRLPVPTSLLEEGSRDPKSGAQGQPLKKWEVRKRRRQRDSRT